MSTAIERVETSWATLIEAIEGIPDARLTAAGAIGTWSVKDVLGHVAYWDGQAIGDVERAL
ncbi:MAG: DinB family protein, partial [Vicinamibacterales bacterium]